MSLSLSAWFIAVHKKCADVMSVAFLNRDDFVGLTRSEMECELARQVGGAAGRIKKCVGERFPKGEVLLLEDRYSPAANAVVLTFGWRES